LLAHLTKELQMLQMKNEIQSKVRTEVDRQQREYFLHQQMKTIQDELGGNPIEQEIDEMRMKAAKKKWTKKVGEIFDKELTEAAADESGRSGVQRAVQLRAIVAGTALGRIQR
jgi:ATP-dependent Lon protease